MAKILLQNRTPKELIQHSHSFHQENSVICTIDRLLAGAANEEIQITFLLFHIHHLHEYTKNESVRQVRKRISILVTLLMEKTPDELYVDCLGANEIFLLLPGVSTEEALKAGIEIQKRFLAQAAMECKGSSTDLGLSGCVISFPGDGKTSVELFCRARDTLYSACREESGAIRIASPGPLQPYSFLLTETQIERVQALVKQNGMDESAFAREALDTLFRKYE